MERAHHSGRVAAAGAPRGNEPLGRHRVRPLVIAHRGASGYLPEHTLEAKALAYGFGADYLEQDIVATRDGELVVLHDLHLDAVSDVAERFPGRARADGRHYVVDFDLAELATLRVHERRDAEGRPVFPGRFGGGRCVFRIATFEQEIELVQELNRLTGREIGLYPEIKHPRFHREHGIELGDRVLETLAHSGYSSAADPVFVQCFDEAELGRLCESTHLKLVRLVEPNRGTALGARGERGPATRAATAGCAYTDLVEVGDDGRLTATALAARLQEAGIAIHAYTLRRDALGTFRGDFETLLEFLFREVGVDGVFTDHPDVALRVRDAHGGTRQAGPRHP